MLPSHIHSKCILAVLTFIFAASPVAPRLQAQAAPQINPAAAPALVPPPVLLRASPRVVQPIGGKLPASMNMAVLENCEDPHKINLKDDHLSITGAGLSLPSKDQQHATECAIQTTLTIDPNTPAGTYSVLILDNKESPVAFTDFTVMDGAAGPIPPGLPPEVDVIWGVMSQNNCSDAFGKRVATSMYCVQLKIGNNSGHPLQIAGVGFAKSLKALEALNIPSTTIANASYASARAVLVQSQVFTVRNLTYNSIVAAGLIMAGGTPFFRRANARANYATATSIVSGPLQQAFNILFPDPIIAQLRNLDDQTFRDNMVIPNNSQIQTVVFVEKQSITVALNELTIEFADAAAKTKTQQGWDRSPTAKTETQSWSKMSKSAAATARNSTRPKFSSRRRILSWSSWPSAASSSSVT